MKFPSEFTIQKKKVLYSTAYSKGFHAVLACNDVLTFLKDVPKDSATLIVTSPPYNIGKLYEQRLEFREYLSWQKEIIESCTEKLQERGSICWVSGNYIEKKEVYPLDVQFYRMLKDRGLKLRNRIVWHYEHGLHSQSRFSGRYETILWFTKSDRYIFNLDAVRNLQKYPGKRYFKGPKKGKPSSNPLGKNPTDVWDIPNVKANHPEKTNHPCQFPIELVERLVRALTNSGNTVLDPFVGVGSSIVAALLNGRRAVGVDKERIYTDIAYDRIIQTLDGTLKRRPSGRPIYVPTGNEKVARIPQEWKDNRPPDEI